MPLAFVVAVLVSLGWPEQAARDGYDAKERRMIMGEWGRPTAPRPRLSCLRVLFPLSRALVHRWRLVEMRVWCRGS